MDKTLDDIATEEERLRGLAEEQLSKENQEKKLTIKEHIALCGFLTFMLSSIGFVGYVSTKDYYDNITRENQRKRDEIIEENRLRLILNDCSLYCDTYSDRVGHSFRTKDLKILVFANEKGSEIVKLIDEGNNNTLDCVYHEKSYGSEYRKIYCNGKIPDYLKHQKNISEMRPLTEKVKEKYQEMFEREKNSPFFRGELVNGRY